MMEDNIGTETRVYGRYWGKLHGGYFSNPAIARPLLETVLGILTESPADVVLDLGGGTGFLLSQLRSRGIAGDAVLVNLDRARAQVVLSEEEGISSLQTSIANFRRGEVAAEDSRIFFLMRSVLHYYGKDGLAPLLGCLREHAREGEFFVHQTASFDSEEEASCLNALYRYMRTHKWYPTTDDLQNHLEKNGWRVTKTAPAPPLLLTSDDLGRRYALDENDIGRIRNLMADEFGGRNSAFRLLPTGFQAELRYRIYTCVAAGGRENSKR